MAEVKPTMVVLDREEGSVAFETDLGRFRPVEKASGRAPLLDGRVVEGDPTDDDVD